MADIDKRSRKYFGVVCRIIQRDFSDKYIINYDDADAKTEQQEWIKKHDGQRVFSQLGTELNDFSLPMLRFWRGVIVKTVVDSDVWPGFDADDVHLALKLQYFNLAENGCPPRVPSFSRSGEAGETLIREMLPTVIRGLAEIGVVIPEQGEYYNPAAGEMLEYDLKKDFAK